MIYVGTSGYSFPDWKGTFYPSGVTSEEMLSYYAARFPTVELNYTYYSMPTEKTMARMAAATPERFKFFVKANEATTHKRERTSAKPFLEALQPFRDTGKLSGILAQFPYSFKNNESARRYLAELKEDFPSDPVVIEFRHESWNRGPVFEFLRRMGLGFCCVDEPSIPGLMPPVARATSNIAYLRFHSRDAAKWFGEDGNQRYNYLYSAEELKEWIPKVRSLAEEPGVEGLFVFFNNCHAGHAAVNATQFEAMLKELGLV